MIEIKRLADGDPMCFEVVVQDDTGKSHHEVTLAQKTFAQLAGGRDTPEQCLEAAFLFLLDRESKESILSRFDVTVISHYFPEFERELQGYLSRVR